VGLKSTLRRQPPAFLAFPAFFFSNPPVLDKCATFAHVTEDFARFGRQDRKVRPRNGLSKASECR